jgi:hypothetical protein
MKARRLSVTTFTNFTGTYSRRVAGSSPVLISETTVCNETIDCDETTFK